MPVMIEVAIGLVFVYLVLSLLCSAMSETLEHYVRYRADYLRQGIEKLLLGGDAALRAKLYAHPLIHSLYTRSRLEGKGRAGGPSYMPSRRFVLALLDVVSNPTGTSEPVSVARASSVAELQRAMAANHALPPSLVQALTTLINDAGDDMEKVKTNLQEWFDGSMDRVSGWYKRRAQFVLLVIGTLAAIVINVDTLLIVDTLSNDSAVRAAVINAAELHVRERSGQPPTGNAVGTTGQPPTGTSSTPNEAQLTADARASVEAVSRQLQALGLPIGWRLLDTTRGGDDERFVGMAPHEQTRYRMENRIWPSNLDDWFAQLGTHLFGWLLTAFAVSFGAPFWFDTLNKIMVIRSTVKPREKSGEEGSEDRPRRSGPQPVRIEVAPAKS